MTNRIRVWLKRKWDVSLLISTESSSVLSEGIVHTSDAGSSSLPVIHIFAASLDGLRMQHRSVAATVPLHVVAGDRHGEGSLSREPYNCIATIILLGPASLPHPKAYYE